MKKFIRLIIRKKLFIVFYVSGFLAFAWFLIRVIPKPSRAAYPCQRAAFPVAGAFILHLAGILAASVLYKKGITVFRQKKLAGLIILVPAVVILSIIGSTIGEKQLLAKSAEQYMETPNQPIGIPKGVIPGRVVWIWDPEAVNENCPNTWLENDNWWMEHNTDRTKVHSMLEESLCLVSGTHHTLDAWDEIFRYYNREHGRGDMGYQEGEKISIKTNFVSCDASNMDGHNKKENLNMIDTSPQVMWSVLNQLVNICGIPDSVICIGDPSAYFPNQYYELLKTDFPDVVYLSLEGGAAGRTQIVSSDEEVVQFSDGSEGDYLPVQFTRSTYMINISVTKHHTSAGFSQIAKNHYGSNMRNTASHMHSSLVKNKFGSGKYRHFVDLLGHEHLGGKTILNIGDFLWSGHAAWTTPERFTAAPFDTDYPSSLLVSIDPIAIESVGLDFIQTQRWSDQLAKTNGVDDYLFQAADSAYWPKDIVYDPEGDGTAIESLGVFEHWNNDLDKQYSGNMGMAGGIELVMSVHHKNIVSPIHLKANFTENPLSVELSWEDLSDKEDGFLIERSEADENSYQYLFQPNPDDTAYLDNSIEEEKKYYYRVRTSAGDLMTIPATISIFAGTTTGMANMVKDKILVTVFPNPVKDVLYISFKNTACENNLRIFNLQGQLIDEILLSNQEAGAYITYDCSNLVPGIYFINAASLEEEYSVPFYVVR
jgi:hypothetical protein